MDDWDVDVHFCHRCAAIADVMRAESSRAHEHDQHLLSAVHHTVRKATDG